MMGSLGLTSTQQKATSDAFAAQHAADRRARQGVDGQIASILTPAQEQQFLAARTKRSQPRQYARILATLGLTASQMQATQGAIAQYDAASCQARQNLDQAINAVLTPAQQSQLQGEMKPKHVGRIR
jgi:Spy/CpxP family protein refolding chaperone